MTGLLDPFTNTGAGWGSRSRSTGGVSQAEGAADVFEKSGIVVAAEGEGRMVERLECRSERIRSGGGEQGRDGRRGSHQIGDLAVDRYHGCPRHLLVAEEQLPHLLLVKEGGGSGRL
jgi:hypothetical protein